MEKRRKFLQASYINTYRQAKHISNLPSYVINARPKPLDDPSKPFGLGVQAAWTNGYAHFGLANEHGHQKGVIAFSAFM